MAMIVLSNGQRLTTAAQLQERPAAKVKRMIAADDLAAHIADLRAEWEEATGGELDAVDGVNLRMLFDDLATLAGAQ